LDLSGAFSNPFVTDKSLLIRLNEIQRQLVKKALESPREPRVAPAKTSPVLETVTRVLERAGRPMRASEIREAANVLLGEPLRWSSVNGVLSAYTMGGDRRFRRVDRGVYELAR
jgi:hypothetical protein